MGESEPVPDFFYEGGGVGQDGEQHLGLRGQRGRLVEGCNQHSKQDNHGLIEIINLTLKIGYRLIQFQGHLNLN